MRKLTYLIAVSMDGFVSRVNGGLVDFSFEGEHLEDLVAEFPETIPTHFRQQISVADTCRHFDTVLMGRQTYEVGLLQGFDSPYQHLQQFVFSRSQDQPHHGDVNLVVKDAIEHVRELKKRKGQGIWLCGGPALATELIDEIDELILKVNPFVMGNGKSLFSTELPRRELQLIHRQDYQNGFSLLRFNFGG